MSKKQEGRMVATADRQRTAARAKDEKAGRMYDSLAKAGKVKQPKAENRIAKLTRTAQGDPNTERARAAQRLLAKRAGVAKPAQAKAAPKAGTSKAEKAIAAAKARLQKPQYIATANQAQGRVIDRRVAAMTPRQYAAGEVRGARAMAQRTRRALKDPINATAPAKWRESMQRSLADSVQTFKAAAKDYRRVVPQRRK